MKRSVRSARYSSSPLGPSLGYTLIEILVATALTLLMVAAVMRIFGSIGESVNQSRSTLEMSDRVRSARTRLEMDLAGITATMLPPLRCETAEGYFEYIEGPVGPVLKLSGAIPYAIDPDAGSPTSADTTVGDIDDRLLFTTRSVGRPFLGRCALTGGTIESDVAEVAWFLRGRTLYRRVLLVTPGVDVSGAATLFFASNDISVRRENGTLVANSLGDLTKRECRYAHWWPTATFPFDVRPWGRLGLPTLRECSSESWNAGSMPPVSKPAPQIDFWNDPHPWATTSDERITGTLDEFKDGPRIAEDVILTNVIGFDVKAWDPGAPVRSDGSVALGPSDPGYDGSASLVSFGAYVDLGYEDAVYVPASGVSAKQFHHTGAPRSGLQASGNQARVYDTWSLHYEHDGIDQDGIGPVDQGTNGFDDNNLAGVDDPLEMETSAPYPVPLRAIQIKIRVYEPDSRQIREVTVVQDFLPK